ncbi:MAG: hypothetical protein ACO3O4_08045 [bacterium]
MKADETVHLKWPSKYRSGPGQPLLQEFLVLLRLTKLTFEAKDY